LFRLIHLVIEPLELIQALHDPSRALAILRTSSGPNLTTGRSVEAIFSDPQHPVIAAVPSLLPEQLGDRDFRADHRLRYNYLTGSMANGIGSVEIVEAMSRAGMLGFFGAAGLSPVRVEAAIDRLQRLLGESPHGFNLIHTPNEPRLESEIVALYLRRGV